MHTGDLPYVVFCSGIAAGSVTNHETYPTTLLMAGAYPDMLKGIMDFCRRFQWYHIGIVFDYAVEGTVFYDRLVASFKALSAKNPKMEVDVLGIWSNAEGTISDVLTKTKRRCRG